MSRELPQHSPYITRAIDNTALASYMECPRKFYYGMVLNRRRGGLTKPALAYGTCWHAILETHYKTGGDKDAVVAAAINAWELHDSPDDHRTLQRCLSAYDEYIHRFGDHDKEAQGWGRTVGYPDAPMVEIATELSWPGALHPYTGKIDRIIEHQGLYYVEDHKAQPLDCKVLTPCGWLAIGSLSVGDLVMSPSGEATQVTGVYPQGVVQAFEVEFSDRTKTRCAATHLWDVIEQHDKKNRTQTLTLAEILNLQQEHPYMRFRVPVNKAIDFRPGQQLPINPYVLGCLIGDGYVAGSAIQLSATEFDLLERFVLSLPDDVHLKKSTAANHTWTVVPHERGSNSIRDGLTRLGLLGKKAETKFLPVECLLAATKDREALLAGLLDTDGNVYNGIITYKTVSERLAQDVCELVRSLGGIAQYHAATKSASNKHQPFRVQMRFVPGFNPFALKRKRESLDKTRETKATRFTKYISKITPLPVLVPQVCIKVAQEDGLYITDDYIVTHNTTSALGVHYFKQFDPSNQMMGYAWLAQLLTGLPIAGVRINAHGVLKTQNKFERQTVSYSPERLAEWGENLNAWVERVERSMQSLIPNLDEPPPLGMQDDPEALLRGFPHNFNACSAKYGQCTYTDVCTMPPRLRGRILESEYEDNPWNPLTVHDEE